MEQQFKNSCVKLVIFSLLIFTMSGCTTRKGNVGQMSIFDIPAEESQWVRNGDPIQYEEELWYPQDKVIILIDAEVYLLGVYKGVQFFVEKIDVRPYNRLYTKFGRNKFRIFEKKSAND